MRSIVGTARTPVYPDDRRAIQRRGFPRAPAPRARAPFRSDEVDDQSVAHVDSAVTAMGGKRKNHGEMKRSS